MKAFRTLMVCFGFFFAISSLTSIGSAIPKKWNGTQPVSGSP